MQYNPEELKEILNIFKVESEEIIQELNDSFLLLEKNPDNKVPLNKLFQLAHSLKGAARMLGFNSIQDIAHKIEDILSFWKKDNVVINVDSLQVIYEVCDFLNILIDKSVKNEADVQDVQVVNFMNKLNNLITFNHMVPVEKPKEISKNCILQKSIDINAIVLELIFVLEKDNTSNNIDEILLVIADNIKLLYEIFSKTDYRTITNEIVFILDKINVENIKDIEFFRQEIPKLRNEIYNLFKELNINNVSKQIDKNINKNIKTQKQETDNEINKDINKKFDFILSNLQKIKYEKNFIKEINEILKDISNDNKDKRVQIILSKIINILNIFIKKDVIIDNDCYIVILQCMYLMKRAFLNEEKENLNYLNSLIERLSVIEDMVNISEEHQMKEIEPKEPSDIVFQNEYVNLKKNLNSINLQEIKTLRIDTIKLDNLISQTGELLINGIKTREHIVELSKINTKLIKWTSVSKKIVNYLKYLEKKGFFYMESDDGTNAFYKKIQDFFVNNADMINEINDDFANLYNMISEDDNKLHQTVLEIEAIAKGIRVLPFATIFHSFPRMVRDIAKENNKKIDFIISGSDTTVDKKIIEEIKIPLIHIIRNSISHGIETREERIKNNKSETGVVKLSAKQAENNVILTIEDDGYGVNLAKVKEIALSKELLSLEEVENMTDEQLMKLLFLPGFTTEESINEISGRGIGLDIVKSKITNLNGDIQIDSILGKGCTVTIKLPLSMSTIKTFIILAGNQKYAIPVNSIKYVKYIKEDEIFIKNRERCIIFENHSIPVYYLSEIFDINKDTHSTEKQLIVIIIENQDKQAAYVIDRLIADQEVFQKKLIPPILKIKNISGFTTLSTGEICLIINPYELIRNTFLKKLQPIKLINQVILNKDEKST